MSTGQSPHQGQAYPPQDQQYPPQGYLQGPPPKKKHTVRNIFLILIGLFILFVGGCMALIGGAATQVDKAIKDEQANDKPTDVAVGKAFEHDGYSVAGGWSLGKEKFINTATIKGLKVSNVKNDASTTGGRTALLTFRLYSGTENLAEIICTGKELQEGESSAMDCTSTDKLPKKFEKIRVADVF
jgi:hypothetical protein